MSEACSKACAVCGRALEPDGLGNWQHALADREPTEDHLAVAVEGSEVEVIGRCDFCLADEPRRNVAARDLDGASRTGVQPEWSACDECAALIDDEQWATLAARSVWAFENRMPALKASLQAFAGELVDHPPAPVRVLR
jgi:hypothetical protein